LNPDLMTFTTRLSILVVLLSAVAAIDWWRYRSRATRWREYGFLLAAGLFGALFGVVNDHITATLSCEYFTIGKGLAPTDGFRFRVTGLGFQAGFGAGAIIGMSYLLANSGKRRPSLPIRRLFRLVWPPVVAALLLAPVGSWIAYRFDPLRFTSLLDGMLSPAEISRFRAVWGIHLGLYAGGLLGTFLGILRLRRLRAAM
jgi:hypothetical protein